MGEWNPNCGSILLLKSWAQEKAWNSLLSAVLSYFYSSLLYFLPLLTGLALEVAVQTWFSKLMGEWQGTETK